MGEAKTSEGPAKPPFTERSPLGLGARRCISADALLGPDRTVCIEHAGELYTLRLTRQNKLLLTK